MSQSIVKIVVAICIAIIAVVFIAGLMHADSQRTKMYELCLKNNPAKECK